MAREDCGVTIAGNVYPDQCGAKGIRKITQEGLDAGRTGQVLEAESLPREAGGDHARYP